MYDIASKMFQTECIFFTSNIRSSAFFRQNVFFVFLDILAGARSSVMVEALCTSEKVAGPRPDEVNKCVQFPYSV
jgi:hypothetical protein